MATATMTDEQIQFVLDLVDRVAESGTGNGEVRIVIKGGYVRYVVPAPHLDIPMPEGGLRAKPTRVRYASD